MIRIFADNDSIINSKNFLVTKKAFLALSLVALPTLAHAELYEITCCDGSVHREMGLSEKSFVAYIGFEDYNFKDYMDDIGEAACKGHGTGCEPNVKVVKMDEILAVIDGQQQVPSALGKKEPDQESC